MRAMVLDRPGRPLRRAELPEPLPGPGQVLIDVGACGVCRTDLHVVDGELAKPKLPLVPGHEIVGRIARPRARRDGPRSRDAGRRAVARADLRPLPPIAGSGAENLCDAPGFTGYTLDGGYAEACVADARLRASRCPTACGDAELAPLLCAGLIGYRSLRLAGEARAARPLRLRRRGAHPRPGRRAGRADGSMPSLAPGMRRRRRFALRLGAAWAGGSDETPPEPLDAAIIFAPVGALVPDGAPRGAQGRQRRLRRHPHERHPRLPLRGTLWESAACAPSPT